ncbi:TKL/DRK protein kinase [Phytophthora cinnamomi]|uniref:TKL/DRK protein kinase n=1 Tax=Phytophthora cinnamomi TaxID=4785 RepID=UPI00355A603F|nr:TKL/DRK protein kinase [Phytophthora cinnamomi]
MRSPTQLQIALFLALFASPLDARTVAFTSYFEDDSCSGTPQFIYEEDVSSCEFSDCTTLSIDDAANSSRVDCYGNDRAETASLFAGADAPYVLLEQYTPANTCDTFASGLAFYADGLCRALPNVTTYAAAIAVVHQNLSVELQLFSDTSCTESVSDMTVASTDVQWTCFVGYSSSYGLVYYTTASSTYSSTGSDANASTSGSDFVIVTAGLGGSGGGSTTSSGSAIPSSQSSASSSSVSGGVIAAIVVGCVVVVLLVAGVWWRKRARKVSRKSSNAADLLAHDSQGRTASTQKGIDTSSDQNLDSGLWNDEVIVAARIPREKVIQQERISRGGYGEVYVGTFNGQRIAIKMLLPETRKRIQSVNDFLAEVKLMASLEHPRIVEFIGVAWDSLTDLCVVSEFMEGGDLRALLSRYHTEGRPIGFDYNKVKIALHVAHALTYMHSLDPPMVHRDLKSKNILLSSDLDAKLTDFGASRERIDRTMTAGVGTSLWMAPEMLSGEKYNEKADMFSFGVVLSELDSNALPYANSGKSRPGSDLVVLQFVMQGKLQVEFSESCPSIIAELGMACVTRDPTARPTAAQALYQLQKALAQEE